MNRITTMLVAAGVLTGSLLFAQENGRGQRNRGQNRGNRPQMQMQMNEETARKWSDVQKQLKEKYPDKFAEIEKLAQTNIALAMQKMNQLAREAKISTPRGGFGGGRGGFGRGGAPLKESSVWKL